MKTEIILGESKNNSGYTIYKNLDSKMVEEILKVELQTDTFNTGWHKNSKVVQNLNEKQILCIDDEKEYFIISNEDVNRYLKEDKLNYINKNFNLIDAINKTFGELYDYGGYVKYDFFKNDSIKYDDLGTIVSREIGVELKTYNGIEIIEKTERWSRGMFCFLNEDGNIENRDYNLDLTKLLSYKQKTKEDLIKEIINNIPDISYKNYGNKWFSNNFAYVLNITGNTFKLSKLDKSSGVNYGDSRSGKAKMPKTTIEVTKEHILQQILPLVNNLDFDKKVDLSKYIKIDVVENNNIILPKKRIQKTIIDENDVDVFDLTDIEEECFEDDIIEALKNIDDSIDIPSNATIVIDFLEKRLRDFDLPSFSFDKGQTQEDHDDYIGYVKMPFNCNFTFKVCEGDACEITWAHSIYQTDIIELELVD